MEIHREKKYIYSDSKSLEKKKIYCQQINTLAIVNSVYFRVNCSVLLLAMAIAVDWIGNVGTFFFSLSSLPSQLVEHTVG